MSYRNYGHEVAPLRHAISITPSDGSNLSHACRALYVGVSGDVAVTTVDGDTVTLVGLAAGSFHPIHVIKVFSTGTTATDIVGGY